MRYMQANSKMSRERFEHLSPEQNQVFQDLNQKFHELSNSISCSPVAFEDLRNYIQSEVDKHRRQIRDDLEEHEQQKHIKEYHKRILDSLWFEAIHSREEHIDDAHKKTFEWIFESSSLVRHRWDNFTQWLENGGGVYWINGKAGSGKSTLMRFLCQDGRTQNSLKLWSGERTLLTPKFFFWSAGRPLEKSVEGLLRSLLWQILIQLPDTYSLFSYFGLRSGSGNSRQQFREPVVAWTNRRLQIALREIIQHVSSWCHLCLFIDGLDEFDGEEDELINIMEDLVENPHVKVCLSSRPQPSFERAFGLAPKLRLQDLTYDDICNFVSDKLQGESEMRSAEWKSQFIKDLAFRAEGCFLWVALAVRDQVQGLRNGDSNRQLRERLSSLPNEVEGVYARMLDKIEKLYWNEASRYLRLMLLEHGPSLLKFTLTFHEKLDAFCNCEGFSGSELLVAMRLAQKRTLVTCAGLLEIYERKDPPTKKVDFDIDDKTSDHTDFILKSNLSICWFHRTAFDFMTETQRGKAFLSANVSPNLDLQILTFKAQLFDAKVTNRRLFTQYGFGLTGRFMTKIRHIDSQSGVAQPELCEVLDRTLSEVVGDSSTGTHWSTRREVTTLMPEITIRILAIDYDVSPCVPSSSAVCISCPKLFTETPSLHDFLGYAASQGLLRYVLSILNGRKTGLDSETADYLLTCSMYSISDAYSCDGRRAYLEVLELIAEILRRGGNPNQRAFGSTIWCYYLSNLEYCSKNDFEKGNPELESRREQAFLRTAMVFVENHATLDRSWILHKCFAVNCQPGTDAAEVSYAFDLQLSTLTILQKCLGHQPNFPQLWDICTAKGAPLVARCKSIEIRTMDRRDYYELSEEDSMEIIEVWRLKKDRREFIDFISHLCDELRKGHRGKLIRSFSRFIFTFRTRSGSRVRSHQQAL